MTRRFPLFWAGQSADLLATSTSAALVPMVAIFVLGAGPQWLGLLTAAAWLPWLLIGVPAGVLIDRTSPRATMIAASLVAALALSAVPLTAAAGALSLPLLLAVALIVGGSAVFLQSAFSPMIATLVPREELERANSRIYGSQSVANGVGPSLAGTLTQLGSAAAGLFAPVIALLISAGCLFGLGPVRRPAPSQQQTTIAALTSGFRWVFGDPVLRSFTIAGGVANFGSTGLSTLLILFLTSDLGLPPIGAGAVLTLGTVGSVIGALAAPALSRRFGSARIALFMQLGQLSVAAIPLAGGTLAFAIVTAAYLPFCFVVVVGNIVRGAWRQRYVPRDLLGRVTTVSQLINYGTIPVAALAAGALGASLGLRPAMLIMAATTGIAGLLLAIAFSRPPLRGRRELPEAGSLTVRR